MTIISLSWPPKTAVVLCADTASISLSTPVLTRIMDHQLQSLLTMKFSFSLDIIYWLQFILSYNKYAYKTDDHGHFKV